MGFESARAVCDRFIFFPTLVLPRSGSKGMISASKAPLEYLAEQLYNKW